MEKIKIALTNLGKYNEGHLIFEWLELPFTNEDLKECLNKIGINEQYEKYFITDYQAPFKIEEYENLEKLNNFVEELENLTETEQQAVLFLIENQGYDKEDTLNKYEDVEVYNSWDELIDFFIDDYLQCPKKLSFYIDYDKVKRNLEIDGYDEFNGYIMRCL